MKRLLVFLMLLMCFKSHAIVDTSLFKVYSPFANAIESVTGIPTSIQLAQLFNETGFGTDGPALSCNNWFSIKDYENDYWDQYCYSWNWNKTKKVRWRKYSSGLISWIDYAFFIVTYRDENLNKPWIKWIDNPIKYGGKRYWIKIQKTIIQYELYKYDLQNRKTLQK